MVPYEKLELLAETCVLGVGSEELLSEGTVFRFERDNYLFDSRIVFVPPTGPGSCLKSLAAMVVGHWASMLA